MASAIKLSSPATREFWEIEVLFEDEHLLVLNKPDLLAVAPDRLHPQRASLMKLLHDGIQRGAAWAKDRSLSYLMYAHRLDAEIGGALLLAKSKPTLISMANLFGSEKVNLVFLALTQGVPSEERMTVDAKLLLRPAVGEVVSVDHRKGKRSVTQIHLRERFAGYALLACRPLAPRPHQVRAHLRHAGFPIVGDSAYGGGPLLLSRLKSDYRLKPNKTERPLLSQPALCAEQLSFVHPVTSSEVKVTAPWPKDLTVAVKYLRRYATVPLPSALS